MLNGMYRAAMGMTAELNMQDTLANNIANAGATAFKRKIPVFSDMLANAGKQPAAAPGAGATAPASTDGLTTNTYSSYGSSDSTFDKTPGELHNTGRDLDLAIQGDAYFTIQGADGNPEYTRSGDFDLDANGVLVTKQGIPVLSEQGSITLGPGRITFSQTGDIFEDGISKGTLLISSLGSMDGVEESDGGVFRSADAQPATGFKVEQGYLEQSNVNTVQEMVAMISSLRAYEAAQKVISSGDAILGKAVNDIGRV